MKTHVLLPALATILAAFAGCTQPDDAPTVPDPTDVAQGPVADFVYTFAGDVVRGVAGLTPITTLARGLSHEAAEPTLGVTKSGAIFYAALNFETGATDILKSTDAGLTWTDVSPRLPSGQNVPPETGDPYVYVDPDTDRIFDYDMFPPLTCGFLSYSDDEGQTWTSNPNGCVTPPPYDHQTLASGKPRVLETAPTYSKIVYYCVNRVSDSICGRSLDGGLTWSPGTVVYAGADPAAGGEPNPANPLGPPFCGGLHGHLAVAPDGTLYLPREYCGRPFVAISRDDGTTWTQVRVSDAKALGGPDPNVAVDAAGNVYYLFVNDVGQLLLTISRDAGATWSPAAQVSPPEVTASHMPAITAGAAGRIAFVYAGTEDLRDGFQNPDNQPGHKKQSWDGYLATVTDALAENPIVLTSRINPVDDPLVKGYCGPGRCPGMYDFIDVVTGPDGRPWAAFVDACLDDCKESVVGGDGEYEALVATFATGPSLLGDAPLAPLGAGNATTPA